MGGGATCGDFRPLKSGQQISKVFTPLAEQRFEGSHISGQAKYSSDKIRQNRNKNC
jgi:hypothetical protein